jgi:arylsulfatase A-like enzyme
VPSRYSIITGRYPARAKMPGPGEGKLKPGTQGRIKPDEYNIAQALKEEGYSTFFTGKWHLSNGGAFPDNVGFDINIAGGHAGSPISYFYPYNVSKNGRETKKRPIHGLDDGNEGEYLTDRLTDETISYLKSHFSTNPEQPFLAYVSHYAVHEPIQAKEEHIKKFRKKLKTMVYKGPEFIQEGTGTTKMRQDDPTYAAMVYSMDESLGRIIETLKEIDQYENTIIIFYSDNGGLSNRGFKQRRVATSNLPLRAGKGHLYEGGIRVPLIVKWPGVTKAGAVSDAMVTGTDFYPTLLEMVGASLKPESHLDGESFVWALKNIRNSSKERKIYWHSPVGRPHATGDINGSAIREGNYKLIEWYETGEVELYDLNEDIKEENNLLDEKPKLAGKMLSDLKEWRESINAYMGKKKTKKNSKN